MSLVQFSFDSVHRLNLNPKALAYNKSTVGSTCAKQWIDVIKRITEMQQKRLKKIIRIRTREKTHKMPSKMDLLGMLYRVLLYEYLSPPMRAQPNSFQNEQFCEILKPYQMESKIHEI